MEVQVLTLASVNCTRLWVLQVYSILENLADNSASLEADNVGDNMDDDANKDCGGNNDDDIHDDDKDIYNVLSSLSVSEKLWLSNQNCTTE